MITESAVHSGGDSFTFKRKRVALGNRRMECFSRFFDLFVARRLRQLFLAGCERVVGNPRTSAGDGLVYRLFVRAGADLFPLVAHGAVSVAMTHRPMSGSVPPRWTIRWTSASSSTQHRRSPS